MPLDPSRWREKYSFIAGHIIVGVMMACFMVTIVQVGKRFSSGWNGEYLIPLGFLISLESMYTRRTMKYRTLLSSEWLIYRGAEWVLILLLVKLTLYFIQGFDRLLVDVALWRVSLLRYFFTPEYIMISLIVFILWILSAQISDYLAEFDDDETALAQEVEAGYSSPRSQVRQKLAELVIIIGGLMLVLTAMMRVDWDVDWLRSPPLRAGVYNVLVYFLLALVLLSLTQFSLLRIGWRKEQIPFSRSISRSWILYSILFISGLAVLSSLLPTSYSVGILGSLNNLITFLMALVRLLLLFITIPFLLLWFFILKMLGLTSEDAAQAEIPQLPSTLSPENVAAAPIPWLEALKSLLFWLIFLGVVFFSLRYYLQEHQDLLQALRKVAVFRWLDGLWRSLRSWAADASRQIGAAGARLRKTISSKMVGAGRNAWRYTSLRRLNPRQRVFFFYLAMVRRGGEHGLPRRPSQTPYEYADALQAGLSGAETEPGEDIASLTDRFVEARYSRHAVTQEQAGLARRYWERIRRALKKMRPEE